MNNNPDVKHISKCLNKSIFSTSFRNPYGALKGNTQWRGLALLSHSLSFLKTSSTIVWFGIKPPFSQLIIALYFTLAFKKKRKGKKKREKKESPARHNVLFVSSNWAVIIDYSKQIETWPLTWPYLGKQICSLRMDRREE